LIDAPAIPDGEFDGKDFPFRVRVFQRRLHGGVKPSPNKRAHTESRAQHPPWWCSRQHSHHAPPPPPRQGMGMGSPRIGMDMGSFHGPSGGSQHQQYPGASAKPGRPKGSTTSTYAKASPPTPTRRVASHLRRLVRKPPTVSPIGLKLSR
jgi:hypothetical protein